MTEHQVSQTIQSAPELWGMHFPEQRAEFTLETLCMLVDDHLVAAAQWGTPVFGETPPALNNASVLFWLVGEPGHPGELKLLVDEILKRARATGVERILTGRFCFGVGWLGVSAEWPHVIRALQQAGFVRGSQWILLTSAVDPPMINQPVLPSSFTATWNENNSTIEWDLGLHSGDALVGECSAWGIPPHFSACPGYSSWCTVEWLGVEPDYRRRGIGRWLLAEQFRKQAQRGIQHIILWTETGNQAVRRLGESLGFQTGPECWEFEKAFLE